MLEQARAEAEPAARRRAQAGRAGVGRGPPGVRARPRVRRGGVGAAALAGSERARGGRADRSRRRSEQTESLLTARREELARLHKEAEEQAQEIKAQARDEARDITSEAHVVARDVLSEGTEVSRNLRELSSSLRNNAERLLRDVRLTHGGMTARLDQVATGTDRERGEPPRSDDTRSEGPQTRARRTQSAGGRGDDLDVPEFIPRR